jgi:DNA-binding MarR family transcriptional regulator
MAARAVTRLYDDTLRCSRTVEITKKGRSRLREALPLWEKAQEILRRKLGTGKLAIIRADLDDLIRAT